MNASTMRGMGRLGAFGGFGNYGTMGLERPSDASFAPRRALSGPMGAECPEGFYRLKVFGIDTGQCLPTGSTAVDAAKSGALSSVGTGVASSPATQAAATSAAGSALGQKIISFYKNKPVLAWGGTAAVAALVIYGGMSFIRGR